MKIIGLVASPRGKESNTLKLVNAALTGTGSGEGSWICGSFTIPSLLPSFSSRWQ